MNAYKALTDANQKEFNKFPIFFAFNQKQFDEGMRKLGLDPSDTDKIYALKGTGGFHRRSDSDKLNEMFERHEKALDDAVKGDATGDGFIYEMFTYELENHEYSYTGSVGDALDALGLTTEEVRENTALLHGLKKACAAQEGSANDAFK